MAQKSAIRGGLGRDCIAIPIPLPMDSDTGIEMTMAPAIVMRECESLRKNGILAADFCCPAIEDKWHWKVIVSDRLNSRYKAGGINFVDGQLYWISDSNGPKPYDRGVFRCNPADLTNPAKHTRLFNPQVESGAMVIQDGVILASHCAPASPMATGIIVSLDMGKTWAQHDLKEFGRRSPCRFHRKNGQGWFRANLRSHWVAPAEMMFIKPKREKQGSVPCFPTMAELCDREIQR